MNINTKMKYFWSNIYYFMFWLCESRLLQFFTNIILIAQRLLLYQDYFQATLSFVNQTITIFRLLYTDYHRIWKLLSCSTAIIHRLLRDYSNYQLLETSSIFKLSSDCSPSQTYPILLLFFPILKLLNPKILLLLGYSHTIKDNK